MAEMPSEAGGDTARGPVVTHVPGSHIQIGPTLAFLVAKWLLGTPPSLPISPFAWAVPSLFQLRQADESCRVPLLQPGLTRRSGVTVESRGWERQGAPLGAQPCLRPEAPCLPCLQWPRGLRASRSYGQHLCCPGKKHVFAHGPG